MRSQVGTLIPSHIVDKLPPRILPVHPPRSPARKLHDAPVLRDPVKEILVPGRDVRELGRFVIIGERVPVHVEGLVAREAAVVPEQLRELAVIIKNAEEVAS